MKFLSKVFIGLIITLATLGMFKLYGNTEKILEELPIADFILRNSEKIHPQETFTLEKAFDGNIPQGENLWTLVVTGDVMLGRTVNYKTISYKDYKWAFQNVADLLREADLAFINLENPLVKNCPIKNDGMIFCASTQHVEGLKHAGIDIASLANNHSMNYGKPGLNDTVEALSQNGIHITGIKNPLILNEHGMKIAILSYDDVECVSEISCVDKEKIKNEISAVDADLVIVMYHWGNEYTHKPSQRQKEFAYLSIDSGADLVLGNHPHWYQPLEMYKDKPIMYSHGNLIFDQMWSEKTREGVISKYYFNGPRLIDMEFIPIYIEDFGQPRILNDAHGDAILENLKGLSLQ